MNEGYQLALRRYADIGIDKMCIRDRQDSVRIAARSKANSLFMGETSLFLFRGLAPNVLP